MELLASLAGISEATRQLSAAANVGFTFSGPGAQALLTAVTEMLRDVHYVLDNADQFTQEPALGQTPAAQVYKPFMASIASDPVQGFIPFLKRLQQDLVDVEASLKKSMEAYTHGDEHNQSKFTGKVMSA